MTGYLRGTSISVNDLVYIPGLGTFQLDQIEQHQFQRDVCSMNFSSHHQSKTLFFSLMDQ